MKSFKEHLNQQLINEIGDTPMGRQMLARYAGKAQNFIDQAASRAFKMYDRAQMMQDAKRKEGLLNIGAGQIGSNRYGNRVRGLFASKKILKGAPPEEVPELNKLYRQERGE